MLFGRVRGSAICTIKYPDLKGMKLLIVQPLNKHMQPVGTMQVAVDVVEAGPGQNRTFMRGIANGNSLTSLVGVYLDEIPVTGSSLGQPDLQMIDLERVEQ